MKKRILAADDDLVMREIYAQLLTSEGYEVILASDGQEAVEALETMAPDLVVLDINMPKLSGWDVLEAVRSSAMCSNVPVLMVSALPEPSEQERRGALGYSCYLTKKTTGNELVALVEQMLAGGVPERGPAD